MEKSIEGTRDLYTHIQREYTFNGSLDKGIEIKIYRDSIAYWRVPSACQTQQVGTVLFSHNISVRTVFFSQFQLRFSKPNGANKSTTYNKLKERPFRIALHCTRKVAQHLNHVCWIEMCRSFGSYMSRKKITRRVALEISSFFSDEIKSNKRE